MRGVHVVTLKLLNRFHYKNTTYKLVQSYKIATEEAFSEHKSRKIGGGQGISMTRDEDENENRMA